MQVFFQKGQENEIARHSFNLSNILSQFIGIIIYVRQSKKSKTWNGRMDMPKVCTEGKLGK